MPASGGSYGLYSLFVSSPVKATDIVEEVRRISGVKFARFEIVDEHFEQSKSLAELIHSHSDVYASQMKN